MRLSREKVIESLVDALMEVQRDVVDEPEPIDENTRPIGDLLNFDSLTSVSVTLNCLTALGFEELPSFPSIFIDKRRDALTVGEVANRIITLQKTLLKVG
jgi:hypothetical protein